MFRIGMYAISWVVLCYAVVLGSVPVFMIGFVLAALASGAEKSPVLGFAVVKGMNFTRGRLGNVGFRQQYVKERGGYKRRTVAFQLPDTVSNPRTSGQVRQRTKFRLIQAIGSALSAKGLTTQFYRSGRGISGYNAFIRDGLLNAIVEMPDGTPYVDWNALYVTKGVKHKAIKAYQPMTLEGDDCHCARLLAWNYDWTCESKDSGEYALNLLGIKVDESGAIDDIVCLQPRTPMTACQAEVLLPKCDCCKTYWYAYFINSHSGYYTDSVYIGTCDCQLDVFDPTSCMTCNRPEPMPTFEKPSECPTYCGEGMTKGVNRADIVYKGASKIPSGFGAQNSMIIYPSCPLLQVAGVVDENETYQTSNASAGLTQIIDNNGLVVTEWTGTGNGDADWSEGNVAWDAVMTLGYYPMVDLDGGTIDISGTNGRTLSKLVVHVGTEEEKTFLFGLIPNTEVLTFLPSPVDAIEEMLIVDALGNTLFEGNPSTLDGGFWSISPGAFPEGMGSLIYTFTLTPTDAMCPKTMVTFEFDGDSLEIVDSVEEPKEKPPLELIDVTDTGDMSFDLPVLGAPATLREGVRLSLYDASESIMGTATIESVETVDEVLVVRYSPAMRGLVDKVAVLS